MASSAGISHFPLLKCLILNQLETSDARRIPKRPHRMENQPPDFRNARFQASRAVWDFPRAGFHLAGRVPDFPRAVFHVSGAFRNFPKGIFQMAGGIRSFPTAVFLIAGGQRNVRRLLALLPCFITKVASRFSSILYQPPSQPPTDSESDSIVGFRSSIPGISTEARISSAQGAAITPAPVIRNTLERLPAMATASPRKKQPAIPARMNRPPKGSNIIS